jgi:hypothetical protein
MEHGRDGASSSRANGLELSGPPQEPAYMWGPLQLPVSPASLESLAYRDSAWDAATLPGAGP